MLLLWAFLATGMFATLLAATDSTAPLVIPRINGTVVLDGLSNEPAWDAMEPLPVMMQVPNFGDPPSEHTEIRIAYDNDYLYAAGRLYDRNPSKIRAPSKKRDQLGTTNDWFVIVVDCFNDKENALAFATTPSGLRMDTTVFDDAQGDWPFNVSWNTFWDVATTTNEEGWFVEMRIPISSLRFQDRDGRVVMGLLAWRFIARKYEVDIFPGFEAKWSNSYFKPSQAREVVFEDLCSRQPLYVAPYVLGGAERSFSLDDPGAAYVHTDKPSYEAGLDVG